MSFVLAAILWLNTALAGTLLVPMAPVVADGSTTSTVRLYVTGDRVKVKPESGKAGPVSVGADHVATFAFTPAAATTPGTVSLLVTVDGEETTIPLAVVPSLSGSLGLSVEPAVLPSTQTATIKLSPKGASPVAASNRRFAIKASVGTVDALTPMGDGSWAARYTPPKGMTDPAMVVLTASDLAGTEVWGVAAFPVTVKRSVSFDAPPASQNVFEIGGRSYGPAVASPAGKVAVDIDLDPRLAKGIQRIVGADTSKQTKEIDVPGAAKTQLAFVPTPVNLPANSGLKVPLRVVQVAPDGSISAPTGLSVSASVGTISVSGPKGQAAELLYTPPSTPGDATLSASAGGASASSVLKITASLPSLTLASDPAQLSKTGTSVKIVARVKDAQGTSLAGVMPSFSAEGGSVSGVKDNKDGSYSGTLSVSSKTNRVRVYATPAVAASGNGAVRLLAWPSSPTVNANGSDQVVVTLVAVDAWDLPVPNASFRIGVPRLDGSAPPTAKADASGVARVVFTAGKTAGLSGLRAEAEGLLVEAPIFQAQKDVSASIPPGGSPDWEAALGRWQAAAPSLVVDREGTVAPSGPPAAVQISSVPAYTTPGAAILVQVRVVDQNGFGVAGQKLQVAASPATPGAITDNKDGNYTLPVQLPAGTDGPLTVTVQVGAAVGSVQLPRLAEATVAAPTATKSTATAPSSTGGGGSVAKVKKPAAVSGPSRFRAGASLVNAHGSFTQTSDGEALLAPNATYGTAAAGFWGLGLRAEWWAVDASWGGLALDVRGQAQMELFSIGADTRVRFQPDLVGGLRYRRELADALYIQAALAAHYTTAPVFRYPDDSRTTAELLDIPLLGARVGALLAYDGDRFYPSVEIAETFAPAPVVTHVGLNADYRIAGPLALHLGGAFDLRTATVSAEAGGAAELLGWYVTVDAGAAVHF